MRLFLSSINVKPDSQVDKCYNSYIYASQDFQRLVSIGSIMGANRFAGTRGDYVIIANDATHRAPILPNALSISRAHRTFSFTNSNTFYISNRFKRGHGIRSQNLFVFR